MHTAFGEKAMKLGKFRKGQIAVVMTLVIATLVGVMSLGADVGVMYYNWVQLQKGADAAAVAGASYLNEGAAGVTLGGSRRQRQLYGSIGRREKSRVHLRNQ